MILTLMRQISFSRSFVLSCPSRLHNSNNTMASTKAKATATTTTTTTVKKTAEASTSSSSGSAATATATARNKHRVLLFGSRGMTSRDRHLVADLRSLLVHHKKESKFDHKVQRTGAGSCGTTRRAAHTQGAHGAGCSCRIG